MYTLPDNTFENAQKLEFQKIKIESDLSLLTSQVKIKLVSGLDS